jgi:hypothetical protein
VLLNSEVQGAVIVVTVECTPKPHKPAQVDNRSVNIKRHASTFAADKSNDDFCHTIVGENTHQLAISRFFDD